MDGFAKNVHVLFLVYFDKYNVERVYLLILRRRLGDLNRLNIRGTNGIISSLTQLTFNL